MNDAHADGVREPCAAERHATTDSAISSCIICAWLGLLGGLVL